MSDEELIFNGINAATGNYLLPPLSDEQVTDIALGEVDEKLLARLTSWHQAVMLAQDPKDPRRQLLDGDARNLAETGWGVIFPKGTHPAVRYALDELLEHRREQAGSEHPGYYQELTYLPGDTKDAFLTDHGAGPGVVDPERVPYYLLIVGGPESIPFRFQYELDVQYAVGRLCFDTPGEFKTYARNVVAVEKGRAQLPRELTLFGAVNPNDRATERMTEQLLRPLATKLTGYADGWEVREVVGSPATKPQLHRLMGGDETPAMLFTATHGVGFPPGHKLQEECQGSLLCQDWPGPGSGPLDPAHYFTASDLCDQTPLRGLIVFHFACYSAGTPARDSFAEPILAWPRQIASHDFIARLPQRLLAQGALAVVGHVDRAWTTSFSWSGDGAQGTDFEATFKRLLKGHPVGSAVENLNQRYAELGAALAVLFRDQQLGDPFSRKHFSRLWRASADAQNYVVLGDPAVRLLHAAGDRE